MCGFFEVADLPLRAVALMLFGVLHEFLLCVYVFVMQCPGAVPVGFYVVNGRLLTLRVEGEDKLIGFCALGCWFRHFVPPLRFAFRPEVGVKSPTACSIPTISYFIFVPLLSFSGAFLLPLFCEPTRFLLVT